MNLKELKEIIQLIQNADIDELEIEREGVRIRIKKAHKKSEHFIPSVPQVTVTPTPIYPSPAPATPAPEVKSVPAPVPSIEKEEEKKLIPIVSPMVGTFYRAPAADAEPYVEVNSTVKKGQVVCIIEAMKLMNEIESEIDGKIVEILVENGQPVEYGQTLFLVNPNV